MHDCFSMKWLLYTNSRETYESENYIKFIRWFFWNKEESFNRNNYSRFSQFITHKETGRKTLDSGECLQIELLELKKQSVIKLIAQNLDFPIVLLKSSALNNNIFNSGLLRGGTDIDILVQRENLQRLQSILASLGNRISKEDKPFSSVYEETWYIESLCTYVDVHFELCNPYHFKVKSEDILSESMIHPFYDNERIRTPCIEHLIIHSMLHFIKDGKIANQTVFDYYYLKEKTDYSVIKIENFCENWQCEKAYKKGTEMVKSIFMDTHISVLSRCLLGKGKSKTLLRLLVTLRKRNFAKTIKEYFSRLLF